MKKSMYDRFLTFLLLILVVTVLAGIGYLGYKYYEKFKINGDSGKYIDDELDKYLQNKANDNNNIQNGDETDENENEYDEENAIKEQTGGSGPRGISTDAPTYKGYKVDGKIEMPTVNLRYPVLEQMTNANALDVSVVIQYGVGLNKVGNTVIAGHNYRSGLFFGSNKKMQIGDSIYITDSETGQRIEYKIYSKYTTEEADTSYFNRNTEGKREVTLVTCQSNNKYRLVILAKEV